MWLFGSSFLSKDSTPPLVSPSQINSLIENWGHKSRRDEFLQELCYTGIPLCYRGTLWKLLTENFLQITPDLYTIFKNRSVQLASKSSSAHAPTHDIMSSTTDTDVDLEAGCMHGKEESMNIICHDVPRTFADIEDFHNDSPLAENLEIILQTYACYRPDVGYVQGMSYLAAMLVYYLDEFNAFKCLANILGRRMSFDFYQLKNDLIHQFTATFDFFFELHLPQLFEHFASESISSEIFLLDWTMTIFSSTFPVDIAARLWDVYLLEGEIFVIRASLGILKLHESTLHAMEASELVRFLKRPTAGSTCPDQLLRLIRCTSISEEAYEAIMMRNRTESSGGRLNQHSGGISSEKRGECRQESSLDSTCDASLVSMLCPPFGGS